MIMELRSDDNVSSLDDIKVSEMNFPSHSYAFHTSSGLPHTISEYMTVLGHVD